MCKTVSSYFDYLKVKIDYFSLLNHKYSPGVLNFYEKNVNGLVYEFACNLNLVDDLCRTPLHLAVAHGHVDVVDLMLKMRVQLFRNNQMDQSLKGDI